MVLGIASGCPCMVIKMPPFTLCPGLEDALQDNRAGMGVCAAQEGRGRVYPCPLLSRLELLEGHHADSMTSARPVAYRLLLAAVLTPPPTLPARPPAGQTCSSSPPELELELFISLPGETLPQLSPSYPSLLPQKVASTSLLPGSHN